MKQQYVMTLEIQTDRPLTGPQVERLERAILGALDGAALPYDADVVTVCKTEHFGSAS